MVDHVIQRYGDGGVVTLNNVSNRIANKQHVDPCTVEDSGRQGIVGGEGSDWCTLALHLDES